MLIKAYDESAVSTARVNKWFKRLLEGSEDVEDDDGGGGRKTHRVSVRFRAALAGFFFFVFYSDRTSTIIAKKKKTPEKNDNKIRSCGQRSLSNRNDAMLNLHLDPIPAVIRFANG